MFLPSLFTATEFYTTKHRNDTALVTLLLHFFAFIFFCCSEGCKSFFCVEQHDQWMNIEACTVPEEFYSMK